MGLKKCLIACWKFLVFTKATYRYPFSRILIYFRNSRYPRLLADFEADFKMTGSVSAKKNR